MWSATAKTQKAYPVIYKGVKNHRKYGRSLMWYRLMLVYATRHSNSSPEPVMCQFYPCSDTSERFCFIQLLLPRSVMRFHAYLQSTIINSWNIFPLNDAVAEWRKKIASKKTRFHGLTISKNSALKNRAPVATASAEVCVLARPGASPPTHAHRVHRTAQCRRT